MYVIYTEIELGTYDSRTIGWIHQNAYKCTIITLRMARFLGVPK